MRLSRLPFLVLLFVCLLSSGCGVTMRTQATSVPDFKAKPRSIFVISNNPNLDKYMLGFGRKASKHLTKEFQNRGLTAWFYDQGSLNLDRKSARDSLEVCKPEAVLVLDEKLGLLSKSWGSTTVKEFEIESSLYLVGSDEAVWKARTMGNIEGSPSTRNTHIELAQQILDKLVVDEVIPPAPPKAE
jgi:hypothetical protein